ncbi:MAG TPA: class III extradiol ring-cleavage dioxygenase [Methylovirgula sp.]
MTISSTPWPTLFIPHGGGPCFFMDDPQQLWTRMGAYLRGIPDALGRRPKAVLVVSGHWLESVPTVQASANPRLLFDYYNFPEHTYQLTWPAPGAPELAARVDELLRIGGFEPAAETARGWDHGVFIPFKVMWPEADVPVMQLSLQRDLDPATHLAMGRALAPLRHEDVLIVGSGLSYHNLKNFFSGRGNAEAEAFDTWLDETLGAPAPARERRLVEWASAPGAVSSHPEAEHLLPLHVAVGAAADAKGQRTYHDHIVGKPISGCQFG